jgi:alpha-beta hydrolase superfamily lysophospholipase
VLKPVLISLGLGLIGTLAVAAAMVLVPWPKGVTTEGGLDFFSILRNRNEQIPVQDIAMRDGYMATVRSLPGPKDTPLVILIHGSGWHGMQFQGLGRSLSQVADVVIPDLRGHGVAPARRGDVDYVGQMEDDLADLIKARAKPGQKVVLLGHSSGGGLVVRFAGGAHGGLMDGAVLMAPFLQHDAPTTRPASGGWAEVSLRRMIGLSILNAFGIKGLNDHEVIRFDMPATVLSGPLGHTATTAYSWRLNTSFGPRRDWQADVAALPPFLLIAGSADEAFLADQYQPVLSGLTDKGRYLVVPGLGHLGIVDDPAAEAAITGFLAGLP